MAMKNRLGGHTNSYHTYSLEEALEGIAAAGFKFVELTAVKDWTEHVPLEADGKTLSQIQRMLNKLALVPVSLSGHSDLTTKPGLEDAKKAVDLCARMGIDIMNTAIGGHYSEEEDEAGFMGNIHELADYAAARKIGIGIEIHGIITCNGEKAVPVIEKINRPNVQINYDTGNCEFWGGVEADKDIGKAVSHMIHCHLKDTVGGYRVWNFPAVGKGHVDFKKVLSVLKKGGYTGPFSVEIEFKGEPWPALKAVNTAMKQSYKALSELGLS
ncbi:MAG: sugar phosphate isomerase/epimerase [Caldilineaceae bacterium]